MHVLRFVTGKYEGKDFPLDEARSFIAGRSTEADLVLADDAVSRKHARFYPSRGRIWVRDLGSRNGTVINGTVVEHYCLRAGDRIAIGSSLAKFATLEQGQVAKERAGERTGHGSDVSGRSMTGSIEEIPLMDVLQWLATSRKTGTLLVKEPDGGRVGSLYLRDGKVFYAAISNSKSLFPEKALMRMLAWTRGSFELESTTIDDVESEISMSLEHMLMEAARIEDELKNLARRATLPTSPDLVAIVSPGPVQWRELEDPELDLLQAYVEHGGWQALLDASRSDDLKLTRVLVGLHKKGVVRY
ncbi:MAG: DUF4388 domain-containing protein [Nannocystaceae bacterium]|nr:DUF4388 domain-containing protein [Nannocystaceae bacterium]